MPDLFQPIASDTPFRFHCGPEVTCFNACCRNLNQFLYPYDAARMACSLGLSAASFLARYTRRHIGPETGLPVVSLKPQAGPQQLCPLVTPGGCKVYDDRPASCRLYPLARAVVHAAGSGPPQARFALIRESHCQGHAGSKQWDALGWIDNQSLAPYNRNNDPMLTVIGFKRRHHPQPLPPQVSDALYDALYLVADQRDASDEKLGQRLNESAPLDLATLEADLAAAYKTVLQILKESAR